MNFRERLSSRNIILWISFWILGSLLIDWSMRYSAVYIFGLGTIITLLVFGFVLGTSGPYPILVLIYDLIISKNTIQATLITFKIRNNFSDWSKKFDEVSDDLILAGITPIFRGVSEGDPSKVVALLKAKPGVLKFFIKDNLKRIEDSGYIVGSEVISTFSF